MSKEATTTIETPSTTPAGGPKTTGQIRTLLASAAQSVLSGSLDIPKAESLHKLCKNISDSLYSETKIAMFRREAGVAPVRFGQMEIGDPAQSGTP